MCDCVYCQGDKPWSGDPDEWPHTPPVYVFLALQDKDPNLWWRMPSGHGQNIAEDAIDVCEELINENKLIKHDLTSILTDLIAELKDQVHYYPDDVFPGFTADDPASQSQTPDRIAGVAMRDAWTRAAAMADRAEARLREVQGE